LYNKLAQVILFKKLARVSVNLVEVFCASFLHGSIPAQKLSDT